LLVFWGRGIGGVLLSRADFLAPVLSVRVTRGDVELEDEFELLMQKSLVSFGSGETVEAIDHAIVLEAMQRIQCGG
jgi:hypothetical protein